MMLDGPVDAPAPDVSQGSSGAAALLGQEVRFEAVDICEADLEDGSALAGLLASFRARAHQPTPEDILAIERAFAAAAAAHSGQRRRSGAPYFVHPVRVARTLTQLGLDGVSVAAGLLHDAVEDSELTIFEVQERFGREVAIIVDGVTKLGKVPYLSKQEQQAESFRKMLLAMAEDIRVLIVKLADRLDNMRTLGAMPVDKQARISQETMQIYAPLAGRLGMDWLRRELQDLSFRFLEPTTYESTRADIQAFLESRPQIVERTLEELRDAFLPAEHPQASSAAGEFVGVPWSAETFGDVDARVTMRPAVRVCRRLETTPRPPEQLSDVATFQLVTRDRVACYAALGQVHARFQPVPGRVRDYVALPRPNSYQALHTTVIDSRGQRIEVQIRSREMDALAERGILYRWERGFPDDRKVDGLALGGGAQRLRWLGELMDWQEDVSDPHEFIEAVKADLFADEVYVFTPKGDIFTFPKGATPIDFAFAIHTDVGMKCSGARVNGHLVSLRYRMRQGDTVEILTNPTVGPREEWLKMCVSSRARAKIKHYLRHRERVRLRGLGRSLVEQEVKARGGALDDLESAGKVAPLAETLALGRDARGEDGVYEAVGAGQVTAPAVVDHLRAKEEPQVDKNLLTRMLRRMTQRSAGRSNPDVGRPDAPMLLDRALVEGTDAMVTLAACCSPMPGDRLVAFFEAGRGIVCHVAGCPGLADQVGQQRVHVDWSPDIELECPVTIEVRTINHVGLLAEMSRAFKHHGVNIAQANCRSVGERATNTFHAKVGRLQQLKDLMAEIREIDGVLGVERVFNATSGLYRRPG